MNVQLKPEEILKLKKDFINTTVNYYNFNNRIINNKRKSFDLLPFWYETCGKEFMIALQNFYDNNENWNDNGLSPIGEINENILLTSFCISIG